MDDLPAAAAGAVPVDFMLDVVAGATVDVDFMLEVDAGDIAEPDFMLDDAAGALDDVDILAAAFVVAFAGARLAVPLVVGAVSAARAREAAKVSASASDARETIRFMR
jgi:hypothetical protein